MNDVVFGIRCLSGTLGRAPATCRSLPAATSLNAAGGIWGLTTTHGKLLSDPFTNQLCSANAAHTGSGSSFRAQHQPDRTTTDHREFWPLASRCSVSERSSGSDQRVSFKGGNSVCPNSTLTFKPEVVGKRYLCGRMLGPGDASSPFFTNLFHCTVTRYSPAGTPS